MSFADELKNMPAKKKEEEQRQLNKNWDLLTKMFIEYIKEACRYLAGDGWDHYTVDLHDLVKRVEEECSSVYVDGYGSDVIVEIDFYNSEAGLMWMNLRNKFYHYLCEEREKYSKPYPNVIGMSKKDAEFLTNELKRKLVQEGLSVNKYLRKEAYKIHFEGRKEVLDEETYSFRLDIKW